MEFYLYSISITPVISISLNVLIYPLKAISKNIVAWFNNEEPLSGFGKIILGESLILLGNKSEGIRFIKEGWINASLSSKDLRYLNKKYKKILN